MAYKIVTQSPFDRFGGEPRLKPFRDKGADIVVAKTADEPLKTEEEMADICADADFLVGDNRHWITSHVLHNAERLRAVLVPFIGVDKIDVDAATDAGVLVVNSPTFENRLGVAEAAVLLMLGLNKRLKHDEAIFQAGRIGGIADRNTLFRDGTVGILGLGKIGTMVAEILLGFKVRIIACDPYVTVPEHLAGHVKMVDMDTLFEQADYLTVHCVLTAETHHMVGRELLARMKPTAYVVNTARGAVIDEEALADAVDSGQIAGAGLDVFSVEPLPLDHRLRTLEPEKVFLTPHNLPHSVAAGLANVDLFTKSMLTMLDGGIPDEVVNQEAIPRWRERFAAGS